MQLIITYAGGAYYNNKATVFKYYYTLYLLINRLHNTALSTKAFDTWVQKGSLTKTGKPNEIT